MNSELVKRLLPQCRSYFKDLIEVRCESQAIKHGNKIIFHDLIFVEMIFEKKIAHESRELTLSLKA